jgi:hypothetical protein
MAFRQGDSAGLDQRPTCTSPAPLFVTGIRVEKDQPAAFFLRMYATRGVMSGRRDGVGLVKMHAKKPLALILDFALPSLE